MSDPEVLCDKSYRQGSFEWLKIWYSGEYPELGRLIEGWTGRETFQNEQVITPIQTFDVQEERRGVKRVVFWMRRRVMNICF